LASYLLISFWTTRLPASKAGLKALIMNRIGDFFLILAICFTLKYFKTLDFVTLFAMVPYYTGIVVLICGVKFHVVDVIALLLVLAAAGKSAQLGLHTWLPDAMEGPTPVSALLHAATMVTAGVYLLLRCSHFLVFSPKVALFAVVLGTLTTLAGGFIALTQMDIKKIIAYSTCSQLGYMITACGSLNFSGSFFHLVNHAFFKALLFLTAGAIIHTLRGEQDIRRMGNLVY
jgi:NADH:ubiquinone oxidoreductase subunit 5 (subunit L)/multisubunit Na+/H+ antiporter MnhA subunit